MLDFIVNNQKYLENSILFLKNGDLKNKISKSIEQNPITIVWWLRSKLQTSIISDMIKNSVYKNDFLYINKNLDYKNLIFNGEKLKDLFNFYENRYKKARVLILENTWDIDWIKNFISYIYKQDIKIIIIWNDIEIWWIEKININWFSIKDLKKSDLYDYSITNILKYGNSEEIILSDNVFLKERFLELYKNDIIYNLVKSFSIKNINLYEYTITYLSLYNDFISLRELHKKINKNLKLALLSCMEYIDYSLRSSIIEKINNYDIKNNKTLVQKAKYFFTDLWFRNNLNTYKTDNHSLKENLVYNELKKAWYSVEWWVFWAFEFSFIVRKENEISYIHISKEKQKNEIIKEMRKIQKAYQYNSTNIEKVYILVENLEWVGFKKTKKDDVELVDFEEFIKKSL